MERSEMAPSNLHSLRRVSPGNPGSRSATFFVLRTSGYWHRYARLVNSSRRTRPQLRRVRITGIQIGIGCDSERTMGSFIFIGYEFHALVCVYHVASDA